MIPLLYGSRPKHNAGNIPLAAHLACGGMRKQKMTAIPNGAACLVRGGMSWKMTITNDINTRMPRARVDVVRSHHPRGISAARLARGVDGPPPWWVPALISHLSRSKSSIFVKIPQEVTV